MESMSFENAIRFEAEAKAQWNGIRLRIKFTGDVGIIQKRCTKKAGVQMYIGTRELLYINQAFSRG
jgi:hypothetical protein